MTDYDIAAVEFIYDRYNTNVLFQMSDEDLKQIIYKTCDELSWANEETDFGTYGEHYEHDINANEVYNYIIKERGDKNATHKV